MKIKVKFTELQKVLGEVFPRLELQGFPEEVILEGECLEFEEELKELATPLEKVKEECKELFCIAFNHKGEATCVCPCHSLKQKEECKACGSCYVCSHGSPKVCEVHSSSQKQEKELPEEINMREVGEYAAETECEISEALTYILWIRYQKLVKYLKQ